MKDQVLMQLPADYFRQLTGKPYFVLDKFGDLYVSGPWPTLAEALKDGESRNNAGDCYVVRVNFIKQCDVTDL